MLLNSTIKETYYHDINEKHPQDRLFILIILKLHICHCQNKIHGQQYVLIKHDTVIIILISIETEFIICFYFSLYRNVVRNMIPLTSYNYLHD